MSSDDATTLVAQDLIKASKNPVPATRFAALNNTHHTVLRSLVALFNIIPKDAEKKSTNRQNGCRSGTQEFSSGPKQVITPFGTSIPHNNKLTPDTSSKGADPKNKILHTSKGGIKISASCNTIRNKSHVP